MPNTQSDPIYFEHEGRKIRAQFQFPSKIWFFEDQTKGEYFGSLIDEHCKIPDVNRATEMYILRLEEERRFPRRV
jgi:hypothetical protein